MDLRGRAALVTGGSRRLGRAISLALGRAGAHVMVHYHSSAAAAEAAVAELRSLGVEADAVEGDLGDTAAAERVVDAAVGRWGRLDVLVNNSGIWGRMPIGSVTPERWDALHNVNLRGAFFVSQRAAPALRESRGAIVNITDVGAIRPWRNFTPYLASKGGVIALTEALAKDLAPEVRVNAVAPGPVLKPEGWVEEQGSEAVRTTLLGRWGTPEDVGQAVVYLATAAYVTGVVLPVDGGQRLF